jgi:hypothetical protein
VEFDVGALIKYISLAALALAPALSSALVIEKVDVPETITVEGKTLVLNGAGIRTAERFGLTFKVFVGALYSAKKSSDANELLNATEPRVLRLTFLRRVDGKDIVDSLNANITPSCLSLMDKNSCEGLRQTVKPLTGNYPDMLTGSTVQYWYHPDRVEFEINGRKYLKGVIPGAVASKSLLGFSIGSKAPSAEFRKALLGLVNR